MTSTITKFAGLQIPLEDILKATNNFHHDNIISQGDFGPAYKGRLLHSGKLIAVVARRLDRKHGLGDSEFWTEVSLLYDLKHTNLVSLIGLCDEKGEKIIITTYQANGSLAQFLNDPNLTWTQRLRICVGVARAMSYLQSNEGRSYSVIHRNINSYTILLDENWEPKLSGFEISIKKSIHQRDRVLLSEQIGTMGYVDPAIEKTRGVTLKSDVYSFGVVLFEILCGREAFTHKEANMFLAPLAKYHYENKTLEDIIHPGIWNQMSSISLFKYSKTAYSCLQEEQAHRPDVKHIVDELINVLNLHERFENLVRTFFYFHTCFSSLLMHVALYPRFKVPYF
ncbi:hypothetical protein QVD17_34707 [Tagetes erecta]|uniref:Protein kinase domain-containing protein n=1 Tax=Tagetes erecta TaxID=13708 RepID=A0AAD8JYS4_TARER|nr:hypothetical protein QVD17_34707 [Tagetes erecta]